MEESSQSSSASSSSSSELTCSFTFDSNNNKGKRAKSSSEEVDESLTEEPQAKEEQEEGEEREEEEEEEEEDEEEEEEEEEEDSEEQSVTAGSSVRAMSAEDEEEIGVQELESICTIGTGTFGRVELCKHRTTARHYALKILNIHKIVSTRQVDHVHNEKRVLKKLDHPFIVKLKGTAVDERNLYMIMEFVPGGELFSYLRASRVFSNSMARFYAAEIVLALQYIHSKNIVYRDLKPENLMITKHGHIKLADFGFAKELRDRTFTLCGTPEYLAPESLNHKGHNKAVDWWALGILIYEMLAGRPPFRGQTTKEIYDAIVEHRLKFPRSFNLIAKDLVKQLLEIDRTIRLGCLKGGAADVREHAWFDKVDWVEMEKLNIQPPIVPTLYHDADTGNFDEYADEEEGPYAPQRERDLFEDW